MLENIKLQAGRKTMTQNRKYFGMTTKQIAILAGLAVGACLLFAAGGWLLLRGGAGMFTRAPQYTPIPQLTSTPFVIPSLTPTETPTPVPYELLVPEGWVQFKTTLVEIWLPKGFKQDKKANDPADLAPPELQMAGTTSQSPLSHLMVMISYEPLAAASLDAHLDGDLANLPADTLLTERRKVTVNSVDAVQMLFETRYEGFDINMRTYVFLDGGTIWFVQYLAQINEFYTMLDTIDASVKTFRVVR